MQVLSRKGVNKYMMLYHGSNVIVQEPQILENGFTKILAMGFIVQL